MHIVLYMCINVGTQYTHKNHLPFIQVSIIFFMKFQLKMQKLYTNANAEVKLTC